MFHFQVFRRAEAKSFPIDRTAIKGRRQKEWKGREKGKEKKQEKIWNESVKRPNFGLCACVKAK